MSSGFVTESEAAILRTKKQEEWERVRKADDPLERPEEPYDCRSLYDRLQEQKQKKDLEYEEAHKLKNMIKGLDDDEIEFLDLVDRTKLAADRKITIEEEKELNDYRNRVATLQEKSLDKKLQTGINIRKLKPITNNRSSQINLLKGAVVKRAENNKRKLSDMDNDNRQSSEAAKPPADKKARHNGNLPDTGRESNGDIVAVSTSVIRPANNKGDTNGISSNKKVPEKSETKNIGNGRLTCIGILPGLGCYDDSSSDNSSCSDQEDEIEEPEIQVDMLGRKIIKKEKES